MVLDLTFLRVVYPAMVNDLSAFDQVCFGRNRSAENVGDDIPWILVDGELKAVASRRAPLLRQRPPDGWS